MPIRRRDFSRRGFFALSGAALFSGNLQFAFGASDFWNKKDPASWTGSDIRMLVTRSPWAKDVAVIFRGQSNAAYPGSAPAGSNLPGDPIGGGSAGQQAAARMNVPSVPFGGTPADQGVDGRRSAPATAPAVTVRWESAQPIRDALKNSFPEVFEQHYVITVTGFQTPGPDRAEMLEHLKVGAFLQAKGKERVEAGVVQYSKDGSIVLFGFAKDLLPLTAADKDVQFTIDTGELSLRAKFDPKEMMYRGQLAV